MTHKTPKVCNKDESREFDFAYFFGDSMATNEKSKLHDASFMSVRSRSDKDNVSCAHCSDRMEVEKFFPTVEDILSDEEMQASFIICSSGYLFKHKIICSKKISKNFEKDNCNKIVKRFHDHALLWGHILCTDIFA